MRRAEAIWIDSRKRWQINVQRDGQRKTFTDSTPGKQGKHSAEQKADKWLTKFSTEQKLGEAWAIYMQDHKQEVTASTIASQEQNFKHVLDVIPASKRLSMITLYDWQKVLDTMAAKDYKQGTIKMVLSTITALNNYALRRRWNAEEIRAGDLQIPKQAGKGKEKQALSSDSLSKLFKLDDTDSVYIYLYQFLVLTGLRIGEGRALEWTDIDAKHVLHVKRAADRANHITEGKTANAIRNIPLIPQAESILDEQRALLNRWQLSDSEYIFPALDGCLMLYSQAEYGWRQVAQIIGTECTLHELRHTFISMSKSTLPLALLKQVAGHSSSMDTIKVYGHETETDLQTSRDLLQTAFDNV